jgi:hypothetical protein
MLCSWSSGRTEWRSAGWISTAGKLKFIVEGGGPKYLPSGHLVYGTADGTMMAVRFDPRKMETEGTPVAVMDDASFWSLADDGSCFTPRGVEVARRD